MRADAVDLSELRFLSEEVQSKISRYTNFQKGMTFLFQLRDNWSCWMDSQLDGCNLTENAANCWTSEASRKEFLSFYLNSHFVQREIESRTMAVGVPKLALFRIESLPLILPPLELQEEFLARFGKNSILQANLEQNDEGGDNLLKALLKKHSKAN